MSAPILPAMLVEVLDDNNRTALALVTRCGEHTNGGPWLHLLRLVDGHHMVRSPDRCTPVTDATRLPVPPIQYAEVKDLDPTDLVDVETGDDYAAVHLGRATIAVQLPKWPDTDEQRQVAELFDLLAQNARDVADELRKIAAERCEACGGSGVLGDDRHEVQCPACGGSGRIEVDAA